MPLLDTLKDYTLKHNCSNCSNRAVAMDEDEEMAEQGRKRLGGCGMKPRSACGIPAFN